MSERIEVNGVEIEWEGPRWYAPRHEYNSTGWITRYYAVAGERETQPETYGLGLGTPCWLDKPTELLWP